MPEEAVNRASDRIPLRANHETAAFTAIVHAEIDAWEMLDRAFLQADIPLSMARYLPLRYLAAQPLCVQDLAKLLHTTVSAASRLTSRMVKDGLLEKCVDEHDHRMVILHATDQGKQLAEAARPVFLRAVGEPFANLSTTELETLCTLLARIRICNANAAQPLALLSDMPRALTGEDATR